MNRTLIYISAVAVSYFLGAVPTGLLAGRAGGVDIRTSGSGNIGATNVFRVLGARWGVTVLILDIAKGFVPAFFFPIIVSWLSGPAETGTEFGMLCGFMAVIGHNWPVYLKFKGGKGVAASLGMLAGIAWISVLWGMGVWIVFTTVTRYVSAGSIAAALTVAVTGWFFHAKEGPLLPAVLTVLAGIVVWRHRKNIIRLMNGTENRIHFSGKSHDR
ncbi:MAG: glycerol-3-phosphate 1-O-acyltransferase PlsY [Kiritimatiellia bacterium]